MNCLKAHKPRPMLAALSVLPAALSLLLAILLAPTVHAAPTPVPDPTPEILHTAAGTTEVGTLAAVPYRIDIPANWNHALIVYFHGYTEGPFLFHIAGPLNEQTQPLFDRGYAIIQSGFSTPGWALAEAYPETEQLRQYFLKHYGEPATGKKAAKQMETIVVGGSMGGALVVANLELNPKPFAGGLDLCGSVGPTDLAFQRRFAWRAAFDFYFPGIFPPLVPSPPDFQETRALRQRVADALRTNPPAAAGLRALTALHTDREVADMMVYFTYVITDLQHRAGGNPFDNRDFIYVGTAPGTSTSDNVLNDGVHRYAADPRARQYLLQHYTPSGRLSRPMLALHTTYDPRIPANTLAIYNEQVAIAGFSGNLVQQYIHREGHCTFTSEEIGHAFDQLTFWIHTGHRPIPGLLPTAPRPASSATATR